MPAPTRFRRLLALSAATAVALGGTLLLATPATAAPGDALVVTSPADGAAVPARAFEVTGTGSDGAVVTITADGLAAPVVASPVADGGAWSVTVSFDDTAATAQSLSIEQVGTGVDPEATNTAIVDVTLPPVAPAPAEPLVVTSPVTGASIDSRFVVFEGTADPGATVTALVGGQEGFGSVFADGDGSFSFEGYFPFELGTEVTVQITATNTDDTTAEPVTLVLDLLAPIAPPVVTAPAAGAKITGTATNGTVTFTGTGTPGNSVLFFVFPADDATLAKVGDLDPLLLIPYGVVNSAGAFSFSTTLPLGNYTASAVQTETPVDSDESEILSTETAAIAFSLVAPVTPAAAGPRVLPATGADSAAPALAGGLLLLGGAALLVAARRRVTL